MKFNKTTLAIIIGLILIITIIYTQLQKNNPVSETDNASSMQSPYIGQELRGIKSLSQDDVEGLLNGEGTPFGGMAKLAELNGYPGPRHVLDAYEVGEFDLSDEQRSKIEALYEQMKTKSIELGNQIIDIEKEMDDAFGGKTITEEILEEKVKESADLYNQLRFTHLRYHLFMTDILSSEQIGKYNELRGYTSGNPCNSVPEGHDPAMWKMHNNC